MVALFNLRKHLRSAGASLVGIKSAQIIKNACVALTITNSNDDVSLIYYKSNMINFGGEREPSEDEI